MLRSLRILLLGLSLLLLVPACQKSSDERSTPGDYGVVVNSIPGLSPDFIKGADVSMLAQIEAKGGKFYDEDGTEKDCLKILKEHGVNWIRLRLWNHPVLAQGFTPESGVTVVAGDAAAGINDLERDIGLAQRAKALGMKVLLDFHYSDWWADPGKQFVPQAWEDMTLEEMKTALHDFTRDAVTQMRAAGAGPDMVQIGNEVTNGMLWPLGRINKYDPSTWDGFVALLDQGTAAVREVDPAIRIMIHIDAGGNSALYRAFVSTLIDKGVDFDVMGASYYPAWHGTLDDLAYNLTATSSYFEKPMVVAETAYAWTTENADSQGNNWDGASALTAGPYLPTVQGQTTFLRDLMAVVSAVPDARGLGIFYWEPDWIAVDGAGWYTPASESLHVGDGWDNQTMFDHDGKALASMNVFRAVSEDRERVDRQPVSAVAQERLSVKVGTAPTLPEAKVIFDDDSVRPMPVTWDDVPASTWTTPGDYQVQGTVTGTSLQVTLPVTVSFLENAGFEAGFTGWSYVPADGTISQKDGNPRSGSGYFHWWDGNEVVDFHVEQEVVLPAGKTYTFSAWAMGPWSYTVTAYATCDGTDLTPATLTMQGWATVDYDPAHDVWNGWVKGSVTGLSGTCTVGVRGTTPGAGNNGWGNLDDLALTEEL